MKVQGCLKGRGREIGKETRKDAVSLVPPLRIATGAQGIIGTTTTLTTGERGTGTLDMIDEVEEMIVEGVIGMRGTDPGAETERIKGEIEEKKKITTLKEEVSSK